MRSSTGSNAYIPCSGSSLTSWHFRRALRMSIQVYLGLSIPSFHPILEDSSTRSFSMMRILSRASRIPKMLIINTLQRRSSGVCNRVNHSTTWRSLTLEFRVLLETLLSNTPTTLDSTMLRTSRLIAIRTSTHFSLSSIVATIGCNT